MARIYEDWLNAYMKYGDNCEASSLYRKWVGVSAIASVLKRKVYLEWQTRIYPNFYIVLVGPPGGRKGTAMNLSLPMLQTLNVKLAAEAITREALIREMTKSTDSYITAENESFQHCSLTIHAQELAVFLGQNNLQLLSDLTDWYDCKNTWTYRTKNMGTDVIEGVWVNLLGATTPSILQNSLPQDAIGGGLTSRIIFVYARGKEKIVPIPFRTAEEIEMQVALTQDLDDISLLNGPFRVSEEMLDFYVPWYVEHERNPPFKQDVFAGYNERKAMHSLKLSMIMSASRSSDMIISLEDFKRALDVLAEAERFMPQVFSGYGQRENAHLIPQIMNFILGSKVVKRKELLARFMADLTFTQLDEITSALCEIGFCKKEVNSDGDVVFRFKGDNV